MYEAIPTITKNDAINNDTHLEQRKRQDASGDMTSFSSPAASSPTPHQQRTYAIGSRGQPLSADSPFNALTSGINTNSNSYQPIASTQQLLEKVYRLCEENLSAYNPNIVCTARSNPYYGALFELLCEKKKQMSLLTDERYSRIEEQQRYCMARIDKMLEKCMMVGHKQQYQHQQMITTDDNEDEYDENEDDNDDNYKEKDDHGDMRIERKCEKLLAEYRSDFYHFNQRLEELSNHRLIFQKSMELSYRLRKILQHQRCFRPITEADIEKCLKQIDSKLSTTRDQLKQITCQNVMMLRCRYLDLSRGHDEHDEHLKVSEVTLPIVVRYLIGLPKFPLTGCLKVSNWFGNKRIRFKKAQPHPCTIAKSSRCLPAQYQKQRKMNPFPHHDLFLRNNEDITAAAATATGVNGDNDGRLAIIRQQVGYQLDSSLQASTSNQNGTRTETTANHHCIDSGHAETRNSTTMNSGVGFEGDDRAKLFANEQQYYFDQAPEFDPANLIDEIGENLLMLMIRWVLAGWLIRAYKGLVKKAKSSAADHTV
ncbi:unnamed protein product [Anisakis simplex]|uniref:PBC domain-containing protein n=1 Tax=Anisakis simplex TaxID=6269 RepID=A0A158PMZ2_ANISI|nr:unnamed protein product [Anisakis simplex]